MREGLGHFWAYWINSQLPPLAYCPFTDIAWFNLHVWGDILTATAYLIFPYTLYRIYRYAPDQSYWLPERWVLAMVGLFVLSCGIGHILDMWAMFSGAYNLKAAWMMLVGLMSIVTDLGLWLHGTDLKRHGKCSPSAT